MVARVGPYLEGVGGGQSTYHEEISPSSPTAKGIVGTNFNVGPLRCVVVVHWDFHFHALSSSKSGTRRSDSDHSTTLGAIYKEGFFMIDEETVNDRCGELVFAFS